MSNFVLADIASRYPRTREGLTQAARYTANLYGVDVQHAYMNLKPYFDQPRPIQSLGIPSVSGGYVPPPGTIGIDVTTGNPIYRSNFPGIPSVSGGYVPPPGTIGIDVTTGNPIYENSNHQ